MTAKWSFKNMVPAESGQYDVTITGRMTLAEASELLLKTDQQDDSFQPDFGVNKKNLPSEEQ